LAAVDGDTNIALAAGTGVGYRRGLKCGTATGAPITFLAALRHDRITAPCLMDGPVNGDGFRDYVERFRLPTLKVMNNLGSHKRRAIRCLIRARCSPLLSAAYSPDLAGVRQAQNLAAQGRGSHRRRCLRPDQISSLLQAFTPAECASYLRNAGYASI
jgi:transposase